MNEQKDFSPAPEQFKCGRRLESGVDHMIHNVPEFDHWDIKPNGDKTCSWCGSLSPEDFIDILKHYTAGEQGYYFDSTTKTYKRYANRPDVKNASGGGIKFYAHHITPELSDEIQKLDLIARIRAAEELEKMTRDTEKMLDELYPPKDPQ